MELVRHPELLQKVEQEVLNAPTDPISGLITGAIAKASCPLLSACIHETLRLHPVATAVVRSTRDDEYTLADGTYLPKNTDIMIPVSPSSSLNWFCTLNYNVDA